MTPKIWVTEPIHDDAVALLAGSARLVGPGVAAKDLCDEDLALIDAIIVRAALIDRELIGRMPRLKVIGKHGAGTDNIDTDALSAAGAQLFSAPGTNAESVADLAVAFALMLLRAPDLHDRRLRSGATAAAQPPMGFELGEVTAGILGLGAIGRGVAERLRRGFGTEVIGYDPGLPEEAWPDGITRFIELGSLLAEAQVLFLHLPLLPQTLGLIGRAELETLPQGAFLVNCARGGVVDERALAEALKSGQLAGAASDVFEAEPPPPDHPLFDAPRFIGTPHIGGFTNAGLRRTGILIAERVLDALGSET